MNHIVCGPPGSGKTTYVLKNKKPEDIIIDQDALAQALTGLPFYHCPKKNLPLVWDCKNFMISELQARGEYFTCWVIVCAPTLKERSELARRLDAQVVILEVPFNTCIDRIRKDERRKDNMPMFLESVQKWWLEYERCKSDIIIK